MYKNIMFGQKELMKEWRIWIKRINTRENKKIVRVENQGKEQGNM